MKKVMEVKKAHSSGKQRIILDFETRSPVPISQGLGPYIKNCEVVVTAAKFLGGALTSWRFKKSEAVLKAMVKLKDVEFICHNPTFDFLVLQKVTGVPDEFFRKFKATEVMSLYTGGPMRLEDCCKYFDLDIKKMAVGKSLIKILSIPYDEDTPQRFGTHIVEEPKGKYVEDEFLLSKFEEYCRADVVATEALYLKLQWLDKEMEKHKIWDNHYLTFKANRKGFRFNLKGAWTLKNQLDHISSYLERKAKEISPGININSHVQVLKFFQSTGADVTSSSKTYIRDFKFEKGKHKVMQQILLSNPSNMSAKLGKILKYKDGLSTDNFKLFGTSYTGRFTSFGVNILNFPRNENNDKVKEHVEEMKHGNFVKKYKSKSFDIIKGHFRKLIEPAEGKMFYGGDFSAIEFRLLLGVAGEHYQLAKIYNQNFDFYVHIAKQLYNREDISSTQRYVAKRAVLAFGYGLGIDTLTNILKQDSIVLDRPYAEELKNLYHKTFPRVRMLWMNLEQSFEGKHLTIPFSKRKIHFYRVDEEAGGVSYVKHQGRGKLWGGSMTGLIIQALAADCFRWTIRNLYDRLGFEVIIPFHDEVVGIGDGIDFGEFEKVLRHTPDFLPIEHYPYLETETWKGRRYLK